MHRRDIDLLIYQGACADQSGGGLDGAVQLAGAFERRLQIAPQRVGERELRTASNRLDGWADQLHDIGPALQQAATAWSRSLRAHRRLVATLPRCTAAMATLPEVFKRHPRTRLLWIDAHPDLNTPDESTTGYLGGMALAGAAGRWDTGLGGNVPLDQIALVGARAIDTAEQKLIRSESIFSVDGGSDDTGRLKHWLGDSPIYIHIDCDVFDPAIVPADYAEPGGIEFSDLAGVFQAVEPSRLIGIEVAEMAASWPDGRPAPSQRLAEACSVFVR